MEISGVAASNGYAIGYAWVQSTKIRDAVKIGIESKEICKEMERFEAAFRQTEMELHKLCLRLTESHREAEAEMIEALQELLHDDEFYLRILHKISKECVQAETAVADTTNEIVSKVQSFDDIYLVERSAEIRDISKRILNHLSGKTEWIKQDVNKKWILITDELTTSYSAQLDPDLIIGCATVWGGKTAHSAIIARSIGLPFVVGVGEQLNQIQDGQFIVLDGVGGKIIVDPSEEQIAHYTKLSLSFHEDRADFIPYSKGVSPDQQPVELMANIGSVTGAREAIRKGAAGIGLFRTELLFLDREIPPTEEEQFEIYREVALLMGKEAPVIIRTLDIGGDKLPLFHPHAVEMNPLLGYRGIRVSLDQIELFKTQLRAIMRASPYGQLKIMFPMIAILQEWKDAKAILKEVQAELEAKDYSFNANIEVGMMIEVPSAALNAEQFAKEVDFFSIGTNDLVQYLMAVDRGNAALSYLNNGYDPTVLRLIYHVICSAHKYNKRVSLCGDMAGQPDAAAIFIGMGLRTLSMNANEIAQVRLRISQLAFTQMQKHSKHILKLSSAKEVNLYLKKKC